MVGGSIPLGVYLGPVHAVEQSFKYCSVLVPYVETGVHVANFPLLVWVNVWCSVNARGQRVGTRFAEQVSANTLAQWRWRGWMDRFIDA